MNSTKLFEQRIAKLEAANELSERRISELQTDLKRTLASIYKSLEKVADAMQYGAEQQNKKNQELASKIRELQSQLNTSQSSRSDSDAPRRKPLPSLPKGMKVSRYSRRTADKRKRNNRR